MEHKGYVGSIETDLEADILYGTVYGINDAIHYEGKTPHELEQAFRDSVDDYLEMCEESGEAPRGGIAPIGCCNGCGRER